MTEFFEADNLNCSDGIENCAFFDNLESMVENLNEDELDNFIEEFEEAEITLDLEGVSISVQLEELSSVEGAIADIFNDKAIEELNPVQ